jgi:hypothetical protein
MQAGDHAARRPRRHVDPLRPAGRPATPSHSGVQRGTDSAAAAPRTPQACPSGHLDAPDAWTPDAWTPDVRSTGWTDIPRRTGRGGQGNNRPGPASGHPRDRRPPARRPDLPGSRRPGALGHPGRLRGDGTCAAALTAVTGQLPSTARHEAAPRRTAVLGKDCGSRVVRNGDGHPLWRMQLQATGVGAWLGGAAGGSWYGVGWA